MTTRPLVPAARSRLDALPGLRGSMKQQRERETAPLWVWLAFGLMAICAGVYLSGYWMVEELITHVRK
ncbi:MAG: hypothetical protein ACRCSO_11385 [Sphingomonas sp.]